MHNITELMRLLKLSHQEKQAGTPIPAERFKDEKEVQALLDKAEEEISDFKVTDSMIMAKERFHRNLSHRKFVTDINSMNFEDLNFISGSRNIEKWAKAHSWFLMWFLDKDFESVRMQAYAELAIQTMVGIINSPYIDKTLTAKDKLKAGEVLLKLADRFPAAKKEVKYMDKDVEGMDGDVVEAQLAEARRKLKGEKSE